MLATSLASVATPVAASGPPDGQAATPTAPIGTRPPIELPILDADLPALRRAPPAAAVSSVAGISAEQAAAFQRALWDAHLSVESFGVTFAAVHDGELVWTGASGVERDGTTPLTPDRPQVIGSVTKTYVAALILQLTQEGRLSLEDSAAKLLPKARAVAGSATVRQLLDHTSGMADVYFTETLRAALDGAPQQVFAHEEVLAALPGPWFEPGKSSAYSNSNYLVLALIAERTLGRSLAQALRSRFTEPLGLDSTRTLDPMRNNDPMPPVWRSVFWGSGSMASNAADLARWGDALYGGDLLNADTRQQMVTFNADGRGLGVQQLKFGEHEAYGHSGMLNTYTSLLVYLPDADVTLAVLVNRSEVDAYGLLTFTTDGRPSLLDLALSVSASTTTARP